MEELYLDTETGRVPIGQALIEKYHLKSGSLSPFTRRRVVDKNGNYPEPVNEKEESLTDGPGERDADGTAENQDGFSLSTSEVLDFTQGTDSYA